MNFLEVNSNSSQFNSLRSTLVRQSGGDQMISIAKLIDECRKYSIEIFQLPDKRFQSGLNFLPLKAKLISKKSVIILFITKYTEKRLNLVSYFEGKRLEKVNVQNQEFIARQLKKQFQTLKPSLQTPKQSVELIQKLTKKCQQLSKQQKSEYIAIQKLKSTPQYHSLIQYQIQLAMQIESMVDMLTQMESKFQDSNDKILTKALEVQDLKNQIEENHFLFEQVCKCFRNVKEQISELLEQQQSNVQKMKINSQAQLNEFIVEAKKLKKLEYQKRLLH